MSESPSSGSSSIASDTSTQTVYTCNLIKALTDFVTQLIHGQEQSLGPYGINLPLSKDSSLCINQQEDGTVGFSEEAEKLATALSGFIASLCHDARRIGSGSEASPESVEELAEQANDQQEMNASPLVATAYNTQTSPVVKIHKDEQIPETETSEPATPEAKKAIVRTALAEARHIIFNTMPIRMLMLEAEGTDIKLVERHEIYSHVSNQIERAVDGFKKDEFRRSREISPEWPHGKFRNPIKKLVNKYTRYVILSHTWCQGVPGEVTYANWKSKAYSPESAAYAKLAKFCKVAATTYGVTLAWMDTICINKDSSSELDESIRSMFRWYKKADACIAYLSQTRRLMDMKADSWFTRGWTLQELIAPRRIDFYNRDWTPLGTEDVEDKHNEQILAQIMQATSITGDELNKPYLTDIPISRRMQWAAKRHVTREEDISYSLMGIFDVSISIAYGEGAERAFSRLMCEILSNAGRNQKVLDIANWGTGVGQSNPAHRCASESYMSSYLIPSGPQAYAFREEAPFWPNESLELPMAITRLGIQVPVLLMPVWIYTGHKRNVDELLDLPPPTPQNGFYARIITTSENGLSVSQYNVLDCRAFDQASMRRRTVDVTVSDAMSTVLAVLNFSETKSEVEIPRDRLCFAIRLEFSDTDISHSNRFTLVRTRKPVTFPMESHGKLSYTVAKEKLYRHGISYRTLYL